MNASSPVRLLVVLLPAAVLLYGISDPPRLDTTGAALPVVYEWRTDHLPDSVSLHDRDGTVVVTRFILRVGPFDRDGARGTLTLEDDVLAFNDYGDAIPTVARKPSVRRVSLVLSDARAEAWEGTLYDVVFADGRHRDRLRVLRSCDPGVRHRLLVRGIPPDHSASLDRILEMRPANSITVPDDRPFPKTFCLHALIRHPYVSREGDRFWAHHEVTVSGESDTEGALLLDRNWLYLSHTGLVSGGTLLGFSPFIVQFHPLGPDPAGRGRRAFALTFASADTARLAATISRGGAQVPQDYILVLAPTLLGPHRLVVRERRAVTQILPLVDANPDYQALSASLLASLPDPERETVVSLRQKYGKEARFYGNDGHVRRVYLNGANDDTLLALRALTGLRSLMVFGDRITDRGLQTIGSLTWLEDLYVYAGQGTDSGLDHLVHLRDLRSFNAYPSPFSRAAIDALRGRLPALRLSPVAGR